MNISGATITGTDILMNITLPSDPHVLVWYNFADYAQSPYLLDLSGNSNVGSVNSELHTRPAKEGAGISTLGSQWISTNYNLAQDFTVSIVASIPIGINNPWYSLWGNEVWDTSLGYIGVFTDVNVLSFGPSGGAITPVSTQVTSTNSINVYDFVKSGTIYTIYINGTTVAQEDLGAQASPSTIGTNIGARHNNDGVPGGIDPCSAVYYDVKIRDIPLDAAEIDLAFQTIRGQYGI